MNISIIVPIYNVEAYIERCLRSIMGQTFTDGVECILVNDCTQDRSLAIANSLIGEYQGNISFKIISHEYNRGIAAVRNTGLDAAQGTYIQYIDSDDYVEPNMLEELYKTAINTNADIVVADYWETHSDREIYQHQTVSDNKYECLSLIGEAALRVVLWIKFIKKELFLSHDLRFLESKDYAEDWRMTYLLTYYANRLTHIPQAFVHYVRYNTNSYTYGVSCRNLENNIDNLLDVEKRLSKKRDWDLCKNSLFQLEMSLKFKLLINSKGNKQKRWNSLFREARCEILHLKLSWYWRIALLAACYGCLPYFNLFRMVSMIARKKKYIIFD